MFNSYPEVAPRVAVTAIKESYNPARHVKAGSYQRAELSSQDTSRVQTQVRSCSLHNDDDNFFALPNWAAQSTSKLMYRLFASIAAIVLDPRLKEQHDEQTAASKPTLQFQATWALRQLSVHHAVP